MCRWSHSQSQLSEQTFKDPSKFQVGAADSSRWHEIVPLFFSFLFGPERRPKNNKTERCADGQAERGKNPEDEKRERERNQTRTGKIKATAAPLATTAVIRSNQISITPLHASCRWSPWGWWVRRRARTSLSWPSATPGCVSTSLVATGERNRVCAFSITSFVYTSSGSLSLSLLEAGACERLLLCVSCAVMVMVMVLPTPM